jgi:hypothetical protein
VYPEVLDGHCCRDPAALRHEWMERIMPTDAMACRPDRVLVIDTIEDYMTVGHKVWEKISLRGGTTQPLGWFTKNILYPPLGRGRVATLCIWRGSSASSILLPFSLLSAERLPPRSDSFALMGYKIPARDYIKKVIKDGCNPLLPNCMKHIGPKPVYEANGPLESMDDIPVRTKRGVREVTTEEWGKLKGYPPSSGTTTKDRRQIIQDPSLHFWSVMGDAFAPTSIHPKLELEPNDNHYCVSIVPPPLSPRPPWEEDSSDDESDSEFVYPSSEHLELPLTWTPLLNGTLLLCKREESGVKHF